MKYETDGSYRRLILMCCVFLLGVIYAFGQHAVDLTKEIREDGKAHVTGVANNVGKKIVVTLLNDDGKRKKIELEPGKFVPVDVICTRAFYSIRGADSGGSTTIWEKKSKAETPASVLIENTPEQSADHSDSKGKPQPVVDIKIKRDVAQGRSLNEEDVISYFNSYIESLPFYSLSAIEQEEEDMKEHLTNLQNWTDREAYLRDHRLHAYIRSHRDTVQKYRENVSSMVDKYFDKNAEIPKSVKSACYEKLKDILRERLEKRESNLNLLETGISQVTDETSSGVKKIDWKLIGLCAGLALLVVGLIFWFRKTNKKNRKYQPLHDSTAETAGNTSGIVVRRKTTSILRKQSLEDVIDNSAYIKIDCSDFCDDSAVRRMYIKNTCIKDIYNMYAEDLRNPDNPKEDGCMVLGRWVLDKECNEYYVSLEHIVLPGDDAVFSEYELNFGGKIKLRIKEKLMKLRKDTNLQYDLTCWVHSHPGLGVFFSNSDSNVQNQLKHPTYPNFLTAIVVDILTPEQELGIFTFKHDSSINSKADLKKLYSLEELYKWAVDSDRNTIKPEDYYNTLANAKYRSADCNSIELSNGAIIDMGMQIAEHGSGSVWMVHGFAMQEIGRTDIIVTTVSRNESVPDCEFLGCFVMAAHCSIPSIRRTVAAYLGKIKMVLVYTPGDDILTSIPVLNKELCTDENYYGEQKMEDLKIWTRRKR